MGLGDVLADLAALGYDTEWDCIPAAAVGAPHLRYRLFLVAYPDSWRQQERTQCNGQPADRDWRALGYDTDRLRDPLADTPDARLEGRVAKPRGRGSALADSQIFGKWPGLCPRCVGGLGGRRPGDRGCEGHAWATEPDVGRVAHGVPHRLDRLRALGNAVVPQVAQFIGEQLLESLKPAAALKEGQP